MTQHRPCDLCGAQPETIYGPDYRFGRDRIHTVPHVYTAQCGAKDCYTGDQFSSFTAIKALGMWDRHKEPRPTIEPASAQGETMNLPPLPKPFRVEQELYGEREELFTAEQVRQAQREAVAAAVQDMTQKDIDEMCQAMRRREFTWDQVNFAVALFRRHLALAAAAPEVNP